VNRTGTVIDSVHVALMDPDIQVRSMAFDRSSRPVVTDDLARYRIHVLDRPLAPGDSVQLAFEVSYRPRGFTNDRARTEVVANGTHFNRSWLPVIGYQRQFELADADARKRFDLPPARPGRDSAEARQYRSSLRNEDLVQVDATLGTAADQIALTPGVLQRSWTENGRRYFRYVTDRPTSFGGTVFSGRYAVMEDRWNDVVLKILHIPAHSADLDRTMRSMKASLEYYSREFGAYPDRQLTIVEIPPYGTFGSAFPHTISFSEAYFLSRVREGEFDQPFYGTAHEVAHHWWHGRVGAANLPGQRFLSESMANYCAMMVTEKTFGIEEARKVYGFQMDRYLRGRADISGEVPVLQVEGQSYIAYRKGAVALYTLRELIGEERVNAALRRFQEKYYDAGPPYPTSRDLYAELRAVTPDSLHTLLSDLFESVTLWEVRTERAAVEKKDGAYEVSIDVVGRKVRADMTGNETEAPMDDLVEIGVFAPGKEDALGEPLHLERHRIRSGRQTIRITVRREPARAGVDPYNRLIDRERSDNVVRVQSEGK
jgi:hypothetical protein